MKQIFCPTEKDFQKVWFKLNALGYKHPNGGTLAAYGLISYQFGIGTKFVNIYDDSKIVKFARRASGTVVQSETFLK